MSLSQIPREQFVACLPQYLAHSEHSCMMTKMVLTFAHFLSPASPLSRWTEYPPYCTPRISLSHWGGSASALLTPQYLHFCYLKSNCLKFKTLSPKGYLKCKQTQMPLKGRTVIMVISNLEFHSPTSHKRHSDGQRAHFNISEHLMETSHLFKTRL